MELPGRRVALVTGAAGGIGRAVVALLRKQGYCVVAQDVSPAVAELAEPGSVATLQADVAASESARQALALARGEFGRLDLLVNNAGQFLRRSTEESTDEDFDRLIATNVRGPFVHAREALGMLAQTRGAIVNVASIAGLVGLPRQTVYAITKGAIVQFTRQLAVEQAPNGIRVNAVAPGIVDTEFTAAFRAEDPDPDASRAQIVSQHPMGRVLTAEEIAEAIVFLASDSASGITGAVLSVDGGYVAR